MTRDPSGWRSQRSPALKRWATKKQRPLHQKDGTVAAAVSPFDGASRIRFKGSLALPIANFRLSIDSANQTGSLRKAL